MMYNVRKLVLALSAALGMGLSHEVFAQTTTQLAPGDDLARALSAARPGDVLELQGGDYGALAVKRAGGQPGQPITLRSADPANPARLSEMDLREMTHLVLDGLMFDYTYSSEDKPNLRPFQIFTTRGLTIRNSVFDGDLAAGDSPEEEAFPTAFGLSIRASAEVVLENNEIHTFYRGLIISDSVDVTVKANDVHSIRMDGMNFAQVERVVIEANVLHDFRRAVDSADHADMIQFWTNKTERPSLDITIRNNVLNSGLGWYTQSIFMRNEEVDTGRAGAEMYYQNVLIEGNVIINAHLHGISVGETDGLIIRNNSVLRNGRSEGKKRNEALWTPQVRVNPLARNVTITRNVLHKITGHDSQGDWLVADNVEVQDKFPTQPNYYNKVFAAPLSGDPRDLASFQYLEGGLLAGANVGAPMLDGIPIAAARKVDLSAAAPVIRSTADPDRPARFTFDISESSRQKGLDLTGAQLDWDFGDGTRGTGVTVTHDFARPGLTDVMLTLTLADGRVLQGSARVAPRRPEVVQLDTAAGSFVSFVTEEPMVLAVEIDPGPVSLGAPNAQIAIPREAMAPFFGSSGFTLETRFRSAESPRPSGVLMYVHKTLAVRVGGRGTIEVDFATETASRIRLRSKPLQLARGDWIDLRIVYSAADEALQVYVNDSLAMEGKTVGPVRPLEHWGLVFGHPFQPDKSFKGEIDRFELKVGTDGRGPGN